MASTVTRMAMCNVLHALHIIYNQRRRVLDMLGTDIQLSIVEVVSGECSHRRQTIVSGSRFVFIHADSGCTQIEI